MFETQPLTSTGGGIARVLGSGCCVKELEGGRLRFAEDCPFIFSFPFARLRNKEQQAQKLHPGDHYKTVGLALAGNVFFQECTTRMVLFYKRERGRA